MKILTEYVSTILPSLFILLVLLTAPTSAQTCEFLNDYDSQREEFHALLAQDNVRLVELVIDVSGYSQDFWKQLGHNDWFQPWIWYRAKGANSERLLLLFHYYYGILKPYLGIGTRTLGLQLRVNTSGCLYGRTAKDVESRLRNYLYYDLKNETERLSTEFTEDIRVCSMHVGDYDGWGRLVYRCCSRDDLGNESCSDITDDAWVWVLRVFIIILSIILFLYFPKFIPKGYYVYTFLYYPPDGQTFNIVLTTNPKKYGRPKDTTVLSPVRWRKMRKLAKEVKKLETDVVHAVKIKCVHFDCGLDRLLSETSSPVSVFRSLFDTLIRCKVRHADALEDCCNAPVCGELCCTRCPVWHAWLRAVRTILVLLVLALPACPMLYVIGADNLEYQELANIFHRLGLEQSYNYYVGRIFGKVMVAMLAGLYVLHMILVVVDGCHDQNLARAYTELLQVTRRKARLSDRIQQSQSIIRKAVWPIKRFGVLAIPVGLVLLALLPVILVVYMVITSPVPKLLAHAVKLAFGNTTNRRKKTRAEMSVWGLVESILFVVTLINVFAVLTLGLNFLVHLIVIGLVQLIVDITFVMKFFPIIVLLLVYVRDAFKVVNTTYSFHHNTVMHRVLTIEAEDIQREADRDWKDQENKIFKIVPSSAHDSKGRLGKDEEEYKKKKLFFFKNDALRMRTRSLVLFLDKDDIPYIPKKFLEHTTTIACPGSPGRIEEAFLRAIGRFGRTLLFLLFIILAVLAYADTYYLSSTSQFFALLFTGTIPLVLRYFFMNPGSVRKVDTSSLRFRTQMDDKVESFMQSWTVDDVEVDYFTLPNQDGSLPDDPNAPRPAQDTDDAKPQLSPPPPSLKRPKHKRHLELPALPEGSGSGGGGGTTTHYVNYMPDAPSLDIDNSDDWFRYQTVTMEPEPGTDALHPVPPHPRKEKRKKKTKPSPVPLVDNLGERPGADILVLPGNSEDRSAANGNVSRKKGMKIDLILDINDIQFHADRLSGAEFDLGATKPPSIHWNRRQRLVREDDNY